MSRLAEAQARVLAEVVRTRRAGLIWRGRNIARVLDRRTSNSLVNRGLIQISEIAGREAAT